MTRALLLLPLLLCVSGCSTPAKEAAVPVAATRPASFTACPQPLTTKVPEDLPFVDRETLNLGSNVLGHKLVFQRTTARRLVLMVGPDPEDTFEDLDMDQRDVVIGGKTVSESTTKLQPGLQLLQVPADLPVQCGGLYVVSERLTAAELDAVIADLKVVAPDPTEAPG